MSKKWRNKCIECCVFLIVCALVSKWVLTASYDSKKLQLQNHTLVTFLEWKREGPVFSEDQTPQPSSSSASFVSVHSQGLVPQELAPPPSLPPPPLSRIKDGRLEAEAGLVCFWKASPDVGPFTSNEAKVRTVTHPLVRIFKCLLRCW